MATTNREIILTEALLINYKWNGTNLNTYSEWQKRGYQVQKGQKALINTSLWKPCTYKDKKTGEEKTKVLLVKSSLFGAEQVAKMTDEDIKALENKKEYWKAKKKAV